MTFVRGILMNKQERYQRIEDILDDLKMTLALKGGSYRREPAEFVDTELIDNMVILKGYRAREAVSTEKRIDELRDAACYAILAMEREIAKTDTIPKDPAEDVKETNSYHGYYVKETDSYHGYCGEAFDGKTPGRKL